MGRKGGPKNKPLKILKMHDGSQVYQRGADELELPASVPEPPSWLKNEALAEWHRVAPKLTVVGVLNELDRAALAIYCQAWGDFCDILPYCNGKPIETKSGERIATGALVKTANGNVIQNPAIGIRNRLSCLLLKAAAEFGMTPAGRADVKVNATKKQEDAAEAFFRRLRSS